MNLKNGLIAYWPLNENAGTVFANKISGSPNGICDIDISVVSVLGKISKAFSQVGTDSNHHAVTVSNSQGITGTTELSVSFWARHADKIGYLQIVNSGNHGNWSISLPGGDGRIYWIIDSNAVCQSIVNAIPGNGNWHLVECTYKKTDSPSGQIYVDNINVGQYWPHSNFDIAVNSAATMIFGGISDDGSYDEICVWNRKVNSADIWNNGLGVNLDLSGTGELIDHKLIYPDIPQLEV